MNRPLLPSGLLSRVESYPSRAAWLAARAGADHRRIGASEVASILGVEGAYRSAWEVWGEKTGALPSTPPTRADRRVLERGQRWEAMILSEYGEQTERLTMAPGEAIGAPGALVIVSHASESWAVCSPDGIPVDDDLGPGLIEGKTDQLGSGWGASDITLVRADDYNLDLAPPQYVTQAYWQLEVTGLPFVDLVCLLPRYALRIVRILPDPGYQASILDQVGQWRERHLVRGEPPVVDGTEACKRYLSTRYPGTGKETRPATAEEAEIVRAYARAAAEEKAAVEAKAELRNRLAASMQGTYGVTLPSGAKALLIPTKGRETVSLSELAKAEPGLHQALVAGGHVNCGEAYRQLRTYGF